MVLLVCDVGLLIECMWRPNHWCCAAGQRSSQKAGVDGCGMGKRRMSSTCGVASAGLWWVSVLVR